MCICDLGNESNLSDKFIYGAEGICILFLCSVFIYYIVLNSLISDFSSFFFFSSKRSVLGDTYLNWIQYVNTFGR